MAVELWSRTQTDSGITFDVHLHPGQQRAMASRKRIIAILAGTQGGKTSFLPWWLWNEIQVCGGGGDYLAVTATYDLFKLKFLPALREVFEYATEDGRYWSGDRIIELRDPATGLFWANRVDDPMWGRIILRSAESGGGLESSTAKAAILDEAGMDAFTMETYEAVRRRVTLSRGRICMGTTLYNLGWLKHTIYDPWIAVKRNHPEIDVIQFDSIANPSFPIEEYREAEARMPRWRFNMQYRGLYERPPGLIYDCFDRAVHTCPRFALPAEWPRYGGLDFGGVHTAALRVAQELARNARGEWGDPTGRYIIYGEYLEGEKTSADHAAALLANEPTTPIYVGGAKSESQWRREFRVAGLPVREPDQPLVEVGINRVYGAFQARELLIFDDCTGLIGELESYRRKLDAQGAPTEAIEEKQTFHRLDALRYIIGWLKRTNKPGVR